MSESFEKAVEAAHAAICEESLSDCLDLDWGGGKCYRAVLAALPHLTRQAKAEAWDEGYAQAQYTHCEAEQPCDATDTNPYAEEADYE